MMRETWKMVRWAFMVVGATAWIVSAERTKLFPADASLMRQGQESDLFSTLDPKLLSKVTAAFAKVDRTMQAIEDPYEFNSILKKQDFEALEFIGKVLLQSRIYNSGVSFAKLIEEAASPLKGNVRNLENLHIRVLPSVKFQNKVHKFDPHQTELSDAFYVRQELTMYLRYESITSLIKLIALILHEATHAYLPANISQDAAKTEAITIMILAKAMKLNANNPAFKLIVAQSLKDLLEKLQEKQIKNGKRSSHP